MIPVFVNAAGHGTTRSTPIRGRDAELGVLGDQFGGVLSGTGSVLVVEGAPGLGKSRLLAEAVGLARRSGVHPLVGEAFECEQDVAFALLATAILQPDSPVDGIDGLRTATVADRHTMVRELDGAIRAAAGRGPLAIVLDNIQWADIHTLLALESLTAALRDVPVLWVLSVCPRAGRVAVGHTLTVLERAGARVLRLAPLAPSVAAAVVQDVLRVRADPALLALADRAGGNPMLLCELVRGLIEEGRITVVDGYATAEPEPLPRRLTELLERRLDGLSVQARRVVQVAAVLPDRFSAAVVAEIVDIRPAALVEAVDELLRADLLAEDGDRLRLRRGLLRDAVRLRLPASLRQALAREAATVLLAAGVPAAQVAADLTRDIEVGDRVAIELLRTAARAAEVGPNVAADLSVRALELVPQWDRDRIEVVIETITLLKRAGRGPEAEGLAAEVLAGALSSEEEGRVRLVLAGTATLPPGQRAQMSEQALELSDVDEVTRARHLGWLAVNLLADGRLDRARPVVDAAAAVAPGDPDTRLLVELARADLDCAAGYPGRAVQRLGPLAVPPHRGRPAAVQQAVTAGYANLLLTAGRLDDAAAVLRRARRSAAGEPDAEVPAYLQPVQVLLDLTAGRVTAAHRALDGAPPLSGLPWTEHGCPGLPVIAARVAVHSGDRAMIREVLGAARQGEVDGGPRVRREARAVLAHVTWSLGETAAAARLLPDDFPLLPTPLWPTDLDHLVLVARLAGGESGGDRRAAVLAAAQTLERESPVEPLFARVARHIRAVVTGDVDELLALADDDAAAAECRPLLQAAIVEDAAAAVAPGDRSRAVELYNRAFETYSGCGAVADARRVGRALRALGSARRVVNRSRARTGLDSLTDAELKVVYLVADGATNRAVARRLHVSPHTVNTHLRRAFAKLGVKSRVELASLIGDRDR